MGAQPAEERTAHWPSGSEKVGRRHCLGGRLRYGLPLEQLEAMWDAYPDVPKFAFFNGGTAHNFDTRSRSPPVYRPDEFKFRVSQHPIACMSLDQAGSP